MERPSRVFSSHHHLSIPPALTGWFYLSFYFIKFKLTIFSWTVIYCFIWIILETNNMEQNEQFRRSRDHSNYFENLSSSTRNGGSKLI